MFLLKSDERIYIIFYEAFKGSRFQRFEGSKYSKILLDARGDLVGPCSFIAAIKYWFARTLKS
jgi:hypothetical protein